MLPSCTHQATMAAALPMLLLAAAMLSIHPAPAAAQYGPDPPNTPADFKCGWRTLVLDYSNKLRPDAAALVYDALQMGQFCNSTVRPDEETLPRAWPPAVRPHTALAAPVSGAGASSVYVDCTHGNDNNPGTEAKPFKTIQRGVNAARDARASTPATAPSPATSATVTIRGGTCYQTDPVSISAQDSGLTITNQPNEEVWLSGGVLLTDLQWSKPSGLRGVAGASGSRVWVANLSSYGLSDIATLRVDGTRRNPARYPDANPETEFWPTGYLTSKSAYTNDRGDWMPPTISPTPNPATLVNISSPNRDWDMQFQNYRGGIGGTCAIYDPPFSFWCQSPPFSPGCGGCFTWQIPSGLETRSALTSRSGFPYSNPTDTNLLAWRKAHWANWAFDVSNIDSKSGAVTFGLGGFQGARGGPGSDWFIANVLEELSTPDEFYYDKPTQQLYFWSNETDPSVPPASSHEFVAVPAGHHTLINVSATQAQPVRNLTLHGLGFRDTAWTMMQPHGVPSGGDWALERMGSLFAEGTTGLTVSGCNFTRVGGNAIMLSKFTQFATVSANSFEWLGGSALALWGWTDEISEDGAHGHDLTGGDFPRYTLIEGNLFREIGVWEKQSSAVFMGKAAQSTLRNNVVFNLARAGFNFNDGGGGGDIVDQNVLFNTCRESSDHGPINSWDRQPFLTTVRTGKPSMQMAWRHVHNNLLVANYGGSKEVDNDDGSLFYNITSNVMVYGWAQKFKCGGIRSTSNLKAYIDSGAHAEANCLLDLNSTAYAPSEWSHDTMIHLGSSNFAYRSCWGTGPDGTNFDKVSVHDNTIYVANGNVQVQLSGGCPGKSNTVSLEELQSKYGDEPGSQRIVGYPNTADVLAQAHTTLGPFAA